MKVEVGSFEVSVKLPQVGKVRLVTTVSLASVFSTLWIATPAYLPFASVDLKMVTAGVGVPFGVGYVSLLLAEWRIKKELRTASQVAGNLHQSARVGEAQVRAAEAGARVEAVAR